MYINCKGNLIDLSTPKVMGIINLTPDSFYDGGTYKDMDAVIAQVGSMLDEGATFIDMGAYSSRPGAANISIEEEEKRIIPVIREVLKHYPEALISVDTFRSHVAREAIYTGACMVNDISAGMLDSDMMSVVGELRVPYVLMHMRGTPQTMKQLTDYEDILKELTSYFSERLACARRHKINDLIIDPGFGFAKTTEQNFKLLKELRFFQFLEVPLLAGLSRKSMIYKTLEGNPQTSLNGTTALNMIALQNGASILRVHDVKEAIECIRLHNALG
ncbi:dihydropteroate synthase [Dokdonia pacifica]|uniref:Dihydropteroate synthase n=1 Tax=Dokdonia pacifica TaxID=1627892 RepID=A0A239BSJ5_9FLAO|nr:dihydropteroate synthase [Dokdonia pacifica]GGG27755.1 dihydropteroate synthase [Dokdonia pacifica]SNS10900.1 dihydropteroate synthase [Dokdonia pacifica]